MTGVEVAIIGAIVGSAYMTKRSIDVSENQFEDAKDRAKKMEAEQKARDLEEASRLKEGIAETQTHIKTKDPFEDTGGVAKTMKQRLRKPDSAANY